MSNICKLCEATPKLLLLTIYLTTNDPQNPYKNYFASILSVEQTSFAMESVRDTQTMVAAMQTAAKQLKVEHKKININQIEDMQDDLSGRVPCHHILLVDHIYYDTHPYLCPL